MNDNYRLPSLHLGTAFDEPVVPLEVPGTMGHGSSKALYILDGANRAPRRLSRVVRPIGMLGVRLAEPRVGVRVTLRLLVDDRATMMWDRHMRQRGEPKPEDEEYVVSDLSSRHRLVEVSAQGRTRALAVFALRPGDDGVVRQHVTFELSPEEIGDSGLVMVGLEDPAIAPDWTRQNQLEAGMVGICVARMTVDLLDERVRAQVSTGRPGAHRSAVAAANPGFFAVNPAHDDGPVVVELSVRDAEQDRLHGRRAKFKHPLRFAHQHLEDRRLHDSSAVAVEVVDLAGQSVLEAEVALADGRCAFELPAGTGPAFVRARKLLGGAPVPSNWGVRTQPAGS